MKVRVNLHCYVFVIIYVKVVFYNYMSARRVFCDLCVLQLTENVLIFLIGMKKKHVKYNQGHVIRTRKCSLYQINVLGNHSNIFKLVWDKA